MQLMSVWWDPQERALVEVSQYSEADDKKVIVRYLDNRLYDYAEFYLATFKEQFKFVDNAEGAPWGAGVESGRVHINSGERGRNISMTIKEWRAVESAVERSLSTINEDILL